MGWAMIQRLTTVYPTISTSMGSWLRSAARRSRYSRSATTCATYTAMTWPDDDRDDGRVPHRAGAHDPDVRPVARGAEEIPAEAEGIRREPDQELALDQEIREVVRQVIRDGDRHQGEHEEPGHGARRELIVAHPGHPAGECHVYEPEEERERDEPERADEREPRVAERRRARRRGALRRSPTPAWR